MGFQIELFGFVVIDDFDSSKKLELCRVHSLKLLKLIRASLGSHS